MAALFAASLFAGAGYAAALSCYDTLAEVAELELIEVTIDGKPAAKPEGYDLAPVFVWRRSDDKLLLQVHNNGTWFWNEEHAK